MKVIEEHWRRVAAIHQADHGLMAGVWLAWDPDTDTVHVYDACVYRNEVLAVIAEGFNARGRWIPIAVSDKDLIDQLFERGCNVLPDKIDESTSAVELTTRDIWERMRTGRFRVDRRLKEWQDEYKTFNRDGHKIPKNKPLMAATRLALSQLEMATAQVSFKTKRRNHSQIKRAFV